MYRVVIAKSARRELKRIDARYRRRVTIAIKWLAHDPLAGKKMLDGRGNRYSLRVWPYPVIYDIKKKGKLVTVARIGHRQGVYK